MRTIGTDLRQRMMEYVLLHVLRLHRRMPELIASQARGKWEQVSTPLARDCTVAVLALGNLGAEAARHLSRTGFRTLGWARSAKQI